MTLADEELQAAAEPRPDDVTGEIVPEIAGETPRTTVSRVAATPDAIAMLRRLAEVNGPLLLHQSGGCCDGSSPMCYPRDDFVVGDRDVLLGVVAQTDAAGSVVGGGVPVYIGGRQYEYWSHTHLTIDLVKGRGGGFSLEAPEGYRFLTRSRLFSDEEALTLEEAGPPLRGPWEGLVEPDPAQRDAAPASSPAPVDWKSPATAEQLAELDELAAAIGEEIPAGMHRSEAAQRIEELRRRAGRRRGVADLRLPGG